MTIARAISRALTAMALCLTFACGENDDDGNAAVSGDFLALSYNVAGLPQGLSGSNPEANTPLISPMLNGYDLVLVQESWQTPEPNPLAPTRVYHEVLAADATHPFKSAPMPLPLGEDPERPSALVSDGLNRFSHFPFGTVSRRRWEGCEDDSSADCLALKGFSVARTELAPGVCVDIYNIHGEAGNSQSDRALKDQNTRDLIEFMVEFSGGRAVIAGGDFNMRLRRDHDAANLQLLTDETGLEDACIAQGIVDDDAIDKFFYRSNESVTIDPTSCRFELERFVDPAGEPLSDHDALAVRFDWRASPEPSIDCQ